MSTNSIVNCYHKMNMWVSIVVLLAGMMVAFSAPPVQGMQMVAPTERSALAYGYSANATTVAVTTTGSTSISCAGRCTYMAVYNGTFLIVYGKGFTPYEVIEFRLNGAYLGRSDTADANGEVVTSFKRWMVSGTYQLYGHEAHTAENSNILTFVVSVSDHQTATARSTISTSSTTASSSTAPTIIAEPPELAADDYSLIGVVVLVLVAVSIVIALLMRRKASSNEK